MSSRDKWGQRGTRSRGFLVASSLLVSLSFGSVGCWEQVSPNWWPQMKRQAAVQAYELNEFYGQGQGLTPPEGTVKVGNPYPDVGQLPIMEQETLENPVPATLASLKNGEMQYQTFCTPCHGQQGHGDGLVAGPPFGTGPFGLVLPVGGPASVAKAFSDGHIFTTITLGRGRMPSYKRINAQDRWDIVNYIRELNGQGGGQ